jgi:ABC-type sugar transport system ATPase subunit
MADAMNAHVELVAVSKRFGGSLAIDDVNLMIERGSIHCLVGENGAGKSTLGKIIAGVHAPDAGELRVAGRPVSYRSPHHALRDGITLIAQELALVGARTAIENVLLGIESRRGPAVATRRMSARYDELLDRVGFRIPANAQVRTLRPAQQMEVEILRALARDVDLIVMDEPTAALTADEADKLFKVIRGLKANGTTIVYVSHRLKEILDLGDAVSVFKDGHLVHSAPATGQSEEALVTAMLGRAIGAVFPPKRVPAADASTALSVRNLNRAPLLRDISFDLRAGEILGLAGLVGSGRTELARAIFGADPIDSGEIAVRGQPVRIRSPRTAINAGIAMLPESRKTQGLLLRSAVDQNVTLAHLDLVASRGVIKRQVERRESDQLGNQLDLRSKNRAAPVSTLSGGNQQKVMFARWLMCTPSVLIVDEPTHGVDIGAKAKIYEVIRSLAERGVGVLLISSELNEIRGLAHRILVMAGGSLVGEYPGDASEDELLNAAFAIEVGASRGCDK